ncbi:mechanosensitive ion channel family protein [Frateuria aurantia]
MSILTMRFDLIHGWLAERWVALLLVAFVAWLLSLLVHRAAAAAVAPWVRRRELIRDLFEQSRGPMRLLVPLLLFGLLMQALPGGESTDGGLVGELVLIGGLLAITWFAVRAIGAMERAAIRRHPVDIDDNVHNRKVLTQVRLLCRTGMVVVMIVGVAGMLMSIPAVRQFGASLMASAGLAGLALGLAARPVLTNILAGLQIAMTQPISLDDCVMIEGELGYIEEITSTYVVVRVWDERRLVVPINYFIEHPIANWTRTNPGLISTVFLWFDYGIPLDALRHELRRICEKAPEWDRKTCILQMCEAAEHSVKIRVLVSAVGMPAWWDLGCRVREGLIDFVQRQYPQYLPSMRARLQHVPAGTPLVSVP